MDVLSTIQRIEEDFEQGNGPFSEVEFPEERLLRELKVQIGDTDERVTLSMEDRLKAISAFATFDYNRDANQLVDNLLELQERKASWFDAYSLPMSETAVEEVFKDIGFRYGQRDAHGWFRNNEILRNNYHGEWSELLLSTGCDAVALVEQLQEDDFLYLKGDKIAPMYARIINDDVCELDNLWKLDIPVDTHIARLTQDLAGAEMSGDDIREWWRNVGPAADVDRHVVDGAMWQIGNKWDEWGEDYWEEVTSD